jgi:hypothetical protein
MTLMCLSGSALMSLGFILASLATKVCICDIIVDPDFRLIFLSRSVVASLPYSGTPRRHRIINVILPRHITHSRVFRPSPWVCDGHCYVRVRRRWTSFRSRHPGIASAIWCTCDSAYSRGMELCDLCFYFLRYAAPSGVPTNTAVSCTRQEGNIHRAGAYILARIFSTPARQLVAIRSYLLRSFKPLET